LRQVWIKEIDENVDSFLKRTKVIICVGRFWFHFLPSWVLGSISTLFTSFFNFVLVIVSCFRVTPLISFLQYAQRWWKTVGSENPVTFTWCSSFFISLRHDLLTPLKAMLLICSVSARSVPVCPLLDLHCSQVLMMLY